MYLVKNDPMDSFNVTIDALVKNDEIPNFNQVEKISEIKVSGSTSLDAKYKENDGALAIINETLICVCGWSLESLSKRIGL